MGFVKLNEKQQKAIWL